MVLCYRSHSASYICHSAPCLRWTHTATCVAQPIPLSAPQDSWCTHRVSPALSTSQRSDAQTACSPRPPQVLVSIPIHASSHLPRFKEGCRSGYAIRSLALLQVRHRLHLGPRRVFLTNGEKHQTGVLWVFFFFLASS